LASLRRYTASRDPDDSLLLAIATAGRAEYFITNDRFLLELRANGSGRPSLVAPDDSG
jgi:predicted nucleic acid-binding protein